jgi:uncharacterized protein (TIRG00374 family)
MPAQATKPPRSWWINLALVVLAFLLLALAVWTNRLKIQEVLERRIDWQKFVLAFGIYTLALVMTFVRWFFLVRALKLPFRIADAMRLGFIGNVYNLVIPGAVGGDLIKAGFLCKEHPENKTKAVASMVIDRGVGLLGLFVLAAMAGAVAWRDAGAEVRTLITVVWLAVVLGLSGLAALFIPALFRPLARLFAGRGKLESLFLELEAAATLYRARLAVVAAMLGMATVSHSFYTLAFYTVSVALFGQEAPSMRDHFLVVPLTLFTTAVPLPFGALGLTEQVGGQLFKFVHHPSGAVAMMGYRVIMYAGGLLSAIVYAFYARQVRSLKDSSRPIGRVTHPLAADRSDLDEELLPVEPVTNQPEHQ